MESESNSIEVVPTNQNIGESGDVMVGIEGGKKKKNGENDVDVGNIIVKEDIANVIPNEAVPDNDAGKGQLISECLFKFSKKTTKNLTSFCPRT